MNVHQKAENVSSQQGVNFRARPTPTTEVFGIQWETEFPMRVSSSIQVDYLRYWEAVPIMKDLFPEVFLNKGVSSPFKHYEDEAAKIRYYEQFGDFFVFRDIINNKIVGMMIITLIDFIGVNLRNVSIAPEYQGSGMYPAFSKMLFDLLRRNGVKTIEGDVSPTNLRHHSVLAKMGYCQTGTSLTRQWGALTHMTKFLVEGELDHFTDLFSVTAPSEKYANRHFSSRTKDEEAQKQ